MSVNDMVSGVWLKPLDTLFFRDGRPFQATSRVESGLPYPQTIAGALRTALLAATGFQFRNFAKQRRVHANPANVHKILEDCGARRDHIQARFRGPWLALTDGIEVQPLLPVPQTLVADSSNNDLPPQRWRTSLPYDPTQTPLPGWSPLHSGLWPLWRRDILTEAERPGGFLTLRGIRRFLDSIANGNETVDGLETEFFSPSQVHGHDSRIGIAIDAEKLTAADGMLYGINLLSLPHQIECRPGINNDPYAGWKIGLYAEVIGPADVRECLHERPLPLGGEGRHAVMTLVDQLPSWSATRTATKTVNYLATPGIFCRAEKSTWLPNALSNQGIQLRGAASDKAVAVSGWDIARGGPKPTRFVVPAGAVYFVEGQPDFKHGSLCSDDEDVAQGWGFALQGE